MSLKSVYQTFDRRVLVCSGKKILENRVKPLLKETTKYHRASAFFSPLIIKSIFKELSICLQSGGEVRLVIGLHDGDKLIPVLNEIEENDRERKFKTAVSRILKNDIKDCLKLLEDIRNLPKIFSELIDQNLIKVKFASVKQDYNSYLETGQWPADDSLFHPKISLFYNKDEIVAISGSINETNKGYGNNIEQATTVNSWEHQEIILNHEEDFNKIWNDNHDEAITIDFGEQFREIINQIVERSDEYRKIVRDTRMTMHDLKNELADCQNYFQLFFDDVELMPHQQQIYKNALSRWPVKALLADEVGLGKTIEAGAIIKYLLDIKDLKTTNILVPASLRYQWQTELYNLFGLRFYIYEPGKDCLVFKPNNTLQDEIKGVKVEDIATLDCNNIIFSWHYLRSFFSNKEVTLSEVLKPDLIVVDEAHGARLKDTNEENYESTLLYDLLEDALPDIPHQLLLTATPQQIDYLDYVSLLNLLTNEYKPDEDSLARIAKLNRKHSLSPYEIQLSMEEIDELKNEIFNYINIEYNRDDPRSMINAYDREKYINYHPTTIFTLRNTRRLLEDIGYTFPATKIYSNAINIGQEYKNLFSKVENYIDNQLFEFEQTAVDKKGIGFVKTVYSQRIVSSIKALHDSLLQRKSKLKTILRDGYITKDGAIVSEDIDGEEDVYDFGTEKIELDDYLKQVANNEINYIDEILHEINISSKDPKINFCIDKIKEHLRVGDKIIVFSRFTSTTNSLVENLREILDVEFGRFQGDKIQTIYKNNDTSLSRSSISEKFSNGDFSLMICSDAASEGLNLQTANVLINLDVPWNPARLLQRFGRIDRFGQKKDKLFFYNLFYPNTVEDKMYTRLHERNENFRTVLGYTPDITSEDHVNKLRDLELLDYDIDESDEFDYSNTFIEFSESNTRYIHDLILYRLKGLDSVTINESRKTIEVDDNKFSYSEDITDPDYLSLTHNLFNILPKANSEELADIYVIRNLENEELIYCIQIDNNLLPIYKLDDIVDLCVTGRISADGRLFEKDQINEMMNVILDCNESHIINHNRLLFENKSNFNPNYEIEKVGTFSIKVT